MVIQKTSGQSVTVKYDETGTLQAGGMNVRDKTPNVVIPVLTPDRPTKRQNGRRFKENGDPSFTLTGQEECPTIPARAREDGNGQPAISDGMRIRRLTPIECERLQGFPDNWTKYGLFEDGIVHEISDTQRYKCIGNAISVPVLEVVAVKLLQAIEDNK